MGFLWSLLIGGIAGWAAGKLFRGQSFGVVMNVVIGVVGAVVGNFLLSLLGFTAYGTIAQIIASTIGAIVVLWVASMFTGSSRTRP